jgi:hypothetical protein
MVGAFRPPAAGPRTKETSVLQTASPPRPAASTRPGLALAGVAESLGPLTDLAGTWIGKGFSLIPVPDFGSGPPSTGPKPFRLKLNSTVEILKVTPIGGAVPNRGSTGQDDIKIFGLRYLQRVSDAVTSEALHIEPGFWLSVPGADVPAGGPTVVRQGSVPRGSSVLAVGTGLHLSGGPEIGPANSTPVKNPVGTPLSAEYLAPFTDPPLPPGFKPAFVQNPNLALQEAIQGQHIMHTVVLIISTAAPANGSAGQVGGGIVNTPFDIANANPTRLDASFWIETVKQADGTTFQQLQYTQTVILNFLGVNWPHICVATLIKQ